MDNILIIGEVGINHNGDIDIAKKLIDMSVRCGCDAVKFQKRDINIVYSEEELLKLRESPWGNTQRDQKEGLEFSEKEYDIINDYCNEKKINWFASAWDEKSLDFLDKYNLKHNKIASAMITNLDFLNAAAKKNKYTFISTGMSTYSNIDKAVEIFKKNNCNFELMHSVSTYPCSEDRLNLHLIEKLRDKYKCKVGYSGHEASVSPSVVAVARGANSLERHITLDRSMYGSDQSASLEEAGLRELISTVRKIPTVIGNEDKMIFDCEVEVAKKLRYWER
jgi:N-acetylneuraminate synthase|tara:strand:- start:4505 stop:5341 length:837 start_codon:yes stop_codon:yes gene_type:complete